MKIKNPSERLGKFWGKVDRKHVEIISKHVEGSRVLDLGAGYGTTSSYLQKKGYQVVAIDLDEEAMRVAKTLNEKINYLNANAESLPFEDNSFDALVLRDALHHFVGEADFAKVQRELNRLLKDDGVMIFFDPNINLLLKTMRKLSNQGVAKLVSICHCE